MRLQDFSPALAFTSTTLRTPTNNNNKVASVSAPTSSQRQGFDPELYVLNQLPPLWYNRTRPAEMAQEITFFLECFEADWFKTFLSNLDLIQATEALQAKLSVSQSSLSKNFRRSRAIISFAWECFVDEFVHKDVARNEMAKNSEILEYLSEIGREGLYDFNPERRKVYFQELLKQVQQIIQELEN